MSACFIPPSRGAAGWPTHNPQADARSLRTAPTDTKGRSDFVAFVAPLRVFLTGPRLRAPPVARPPGPGLLHQARLLQGGGGLLHLVDQVDRRIGRQHQPAGRVAAPGQRLRPASSSSMRVMPNSIRMRLAVEEHADDRIGEGLAAFRLVDIADRGGSACPAGSRHCPSKRTPGCDSAIGILEFSRPRRSGRRPGFRSRPSLRRLPCRALPP